MAFFDEIGKKITSAGQGVVQSTKNTADIMRLNSAISEKEKQIAQLKAAIGAAYYEAHRDDAEAEQRENIELINGLNKEIEANRQEIESIRGGANSPQGQPAAEGGRVCPTCGKPVPEQNAFCVNCGTKL